MRYIYLRLLALVLGATPGLVYISFGIVRWDEGWLLLALGMLIGFLLALHAVSPRQIFRQTWYLYFPIGVPLTLMFPPLDEGDSQDVTPEPETHEPIPVARFELDWLTNDVLGLAYTIDAQESLNLRPILADALEEAGCDDPTILSHCRSENDDKPYWVTNMILRLNIESLKQSSGDSMD